MMDKLQIVAEINGDESDYENLSGGERFRVDFAIRVALGQVLSHRSGTTIDVLILDEGWGTQDEEGIEAMLQSLASVRSEFGLVLVITHHTSVIERFEHRIECVRDGKVSTASIAA